MNYEKITKTTARKLHTKGEKVYCLPSKANPWSTWW